MITLSNGHKFEYLAAGGALGYDGQGWLHEQPLRMFDLFEPRLFTAVTKTLTLMRTPGNFRWRQPWDTIQLIPNGVVNSMGLTNIGFGAWSKQYGSRIKRAKQSVIVSITADASTGEGGLQHLRQMAQNLNKFDLVGIQYNPSCPNIADRASANTEFIIDACYQLRVASRHPLSIKLGIDNDLAAIVPEVSGLVEFFEVNSIPWRYYSRAPSPLKKYGGGGVSGGAVKLLTRNVAREIQHLTSTPVVGPSAWDYADILELRKLGFPAVSFGSIWLRYPWRPTLYVRCGQYDRTVAPTEPTNRMTKYIDP